MIYCCRSEGVGRPHCDLEPLGGELVAQLADGGGLAHAVDPDNQKHVRTVRRGDGEVCGAVSTVGFQHACDLLAQHGEQKVDGLGALPGGALFNALNDAGGCSDANVAGDEGLLQLLQDVGVDVFLAQYRAGKLLEDAAFGARKATIQRFLFFRAEQPLEK